MGALLMGFWSWVLALSIPALRILALGVLPLEVLPLAFSSSALGRQCQSSWPIESAGGSDRRRPPQGKPAAAFDLIS